MPLINYRNYGRLWRVYGRSVVRYGSLKKVWNALRTEAAYRRRQADVPSAPYILNIEPLYYCNLDCPLCDRQVFPTARKKDAGRLPLEIIDKIFAEVGDYLFQCQIFGQGEPTLDWKRSQYIIDEAHKRRIFTLLSTNCTLITPQMAQEIVSSPLDHLVCAIDGISQESYSVYRVGGKVEEALRGLRLVCAERDRQQSKITIEWQFLVHKHNIHEIDAARKIAEELNVVLRFSPLAGMEWNPALQEFWLPESDKWQDRRKAAGTVLYEWPCYFLWRALIINSNAKLARCLIYQNVAQYGNLHEGSVMEFYNGLESQRARQLFQQGPVPDGDFPSPCKNCSYYERHHGGPNMDKGSSIDLPTSNGTKFAIPLEPRSPVEEK
jgi:MoaA/NifB/PqqE/SkfB family radical SAM enzyme